MLANVNDYPVILQTWVDQGQGVQITLKFRLSLCRLFLK
jgi:P pilus assembly chaperone PapD